MGVEKSETTCTCGCEEGNCTCDDTCTCGCQEDSSVCECNQDNQ